MIRTAICNIISITRVTRVINGLGLCTICGSQRTKSCLSCCIFRLIHGLLGVVAVEARVLLVGSAKLQGTVATEILHDVNIQSCHNSILLCYNDASLMYLDSCKRFGINRTTYLQLGKDCRQGSEGLVREMSQNLWIPPADEGLAARL